LLAARPGLAAVSGLTVVDLGFGASPVTTFELAARLRAVNPGVRVVGLDFDVARVAAAQQRRTDLPVTFAVGGFELAGLRPHVVRACNVLRQYPAEEVPRWWSELGSRLAPGGVVIDGTCDETGGLGAWVTLDNAGPRTLTLAVDLARPPSAVAARLPKALIAHNVPGQRVHDLLVALDAAWRRASPVAVFGPAQRFAAAVATVRSSGWPVVGGPRRWRRGELTLAWEAVRPDGR
jgi:hypothetical protein